MRSLYKFIIIFALCSIRYDINALPLHWRKCCAQTMSAGSLVP